MKGLFFRYGDKDFSFTDCTSFVVMQQLKLKQALTTDRHFITGRFSDCIVTGLSPQNCRVRILPAVVAVVEALL